MNIKFIQNRMNKVWAWLLRADQVMRIQQVDLHHQRDRHLSINMMDTCHQHDGRFLCKWGPLGWAVLVPPNISACICNEYKNMPTSILAISTKKKFDWNNSPHKFRCSVLDCRWLMRNKHARGDQLLLIWLQISDPNSQKNLWTTIFYYYLFYYLFIIIYFYLIKFYFIKLKKIKKKKIFLNYFIKFY